MEYLIGAFCGGALVIVVGYIAFVWWAIYTVTGDKNWMGIPFLKRGDNGKKP